MLFVHLQDVLTSQSSQGSTNEAALLVLGRTLKHFTAILQYFVSFLLLQS